MTDIPAEVVNELIDVRQARAAGTEPPSGVHICQVLAGVEWFTTGDHWFCPFCREQGPGYATEAAS